MMREVKSSIFRPHDMAVLRSHLGRTRPGRKREEEREKRRQEEERRQEERRRQERRGWDTIGPAIIV